jgi:hypothetical protein
MTIEDVTPEETVKIAGILETKVAQAFADRAQFKAEAESLRVALDAMAMERDYWRNRTEESERDRDEHGECEEFMHKQWESVAAIAKETIARRTERRRKQVRLAALGDDPPPSVVVFNRNPS